jgi:hypothetical protein
LSCDGAVWNFRKRLTFLHRKNFKEAQKLSPYQKKKYVWKMLYIYVLGYEVQADRVLESAE